MYGDKSSIEAWESRRGYVPVGPKYDLRAAPELLARARALREDRDLDSASPLPEILGNRNKPAIPKKDWRDAYERRRGEIRARQRREWVEKIAEVSRSIRESGQPAYPDVIGKALGILPGTVLNFCRMEDARHLYDRRPNHG